VTVLRARALESLNWLVHGFSTRVGGVSRLRAATALNLGSADWDSAEAVAANRQRFLAALAPSHQRSKHSKGALVTLRQCHSDVIRAVSAPLEEDVAGDALLTSTPGLPLAVRTADCLPILLADKRHRAVAAVHAGWRGTLARIAQKALGRMNMEFGTRPGDVVAALGPAIGRCCYEVGPEVVQAYAAQFANASEWFDGPFERLAANDDPAPFPWLSMTPPGHEAPVPRALLDLQAANRWQLASAGIPGSQIHASDLCTACRTDLLFSHRREQGRTGRMLAVIGILRRTQA
jgi:polyphenol oxidase